MSRFGDDDEPDFDEAPNAVCSDCGTGYGRADGDPTTWCDPCSDRRDGWVSALEVRMHADRRAWVIDRLPTVSAVAASRKGQSFPKKQVAKRKAVA